MTTIEKRIVELKALGAGDDECRQCLDLSINPMSICRSCIAHTQAFNIAMEAIARNPIKRSVWDLA